MLKIVCAICICLSALPAVSQRAVKYEVATIITVKPHPSGTDDPLTGIASYEISTRVGDTVYLVLYTDKLGTKTIQYAGGRQLLVLVGKTTILYNDILGQSHELPIISRKPALVAQQSK